VYNHRFTDTKIYRSWLFKLLNYEIRQKTKQLAHESGKYPLLLQDLRNLTSFLDFNCLKGLLTRNNDKDLVRIKTRHLRKLHNLGLTPEYEVDSSKVIFNYSNRNLSEDETKLLSLGLDFALPCKSPSFADHFLAFERLCHTVNNCQILDNSESAKLKVFEKIASLANETFYDFKRHRHWLPSFSKAKYNALKSLKEDPNIIITRPDKGKGVVILERNEYITKVNILLSDHTKFKMLGNEPFSKIIQLEDKLNRMLKCLKDSDAISSDTYNQLRASGSLPGMLYGLPKIHKPDVPIRPILSALKTFNYNLAKFLVPILKPITTNEYTVHNSFDFAKQLSTISLENNVIMASFDIQSLFTNIPLKETMDICTNRLFENTDNVHNLTRDQFKKLLKLSVEDAIFMFNNQLYSQIDGVAMGSPLGPTLANAFLCHHESKWLADCPSHFKPVMYKRYVDDVFLLFNDVSHVKMFLDYVNSKHVNIQFTSEVEVNNSLSFLDIRLERDDKTFKTSVYRKPTFTGSGLNYLSFLPMMFKINAIRTLLYRCFHICSDWHSINRELQFLETFFLKNKFPMSVIQKQIRLFLNKMLCPKPMNYNVPRDIRYLKLPYYGHTSFVLRKQLQKLLSNHFPQINFRMIFTNSRTIRSFFPTKDPFPKHLCSNIVYSYKCSSCNARYIGSTSRNLKMRYCEHKGVSYRTLRPLSSPMHSLIRDHSLKTNHEVKFEDFSIVRKTQDLIDLRILESLLIKEIKPNLNNNESSVTLYTLK